MEDFIASTYGILTLVCLLAIVAVVVAGFWKTFEKAGYEGWFALIPVLNLFVLIQIAEKPDWWIALYFFPLVNLFVGAAVAMAVAERFGRSTLFGLGLFLAPYVCYPILGFGYDEYVPDIDLDAV
ncbi:MAG: DUF5684 domain-containing protein [Bacteroidota bacterium]